MSRYTEMIVSIHYTL